MDRLATQEAEFYRAQEALRNERLARIREPFLDATSQLLMATVTLGVESPSRPLHESRLASPAAETLARQAEDESHQQLLRLTGGATVNAAFRHQESLTNSYSA